MFFWNSEASWERCHTWIPTAFWLEICWLLTFGSKQLINQNCIFKTQVLCFLSFAALVATRLVAIWGVCMQPPRDVHNLEAPRLVMSACDFCGFLAFHMLFSWFWKLKFEKAKLKSQIGSVTLAQAPLTIEKSAPVLGWSHGVKFLWGMGMQSKQNTSRIIFWARFWQVEFKKKQIEMQNS